MLARVAAAIISFLTALLGVSLNAIVLFVLPELPRNYLAKSVRWTTWSKCVCNILMSLFPTYIGIMALFEIPFFQEHSHIIGTTSMIFYEFSNISSLFMALNRFVACILPTSYNRFFTTHTILVILAMISLVSISYSVTLCEVLGYQLVYNSTTCTFSFGSSGTRSLPVHISDLGLNVSLMVITIALNCLCVFRDQIVHSPMQRSPAHIEAANRMVMISMIQNEIVIAGQVSFYSAAPLVDHLHPVLFFLLSNFWGFTHAIEAGIILASSKGMKKVLKKRFGSNRCQVAVGPAPSVVSGNNTESGMGQRLFQKVTNPLRRYNF